jgi:hypothetical protein
MVKYWIGPHTDMTTYLQFAAKFHELTMQASLVEVLLCVVRTGVIDGNIPLGALSSATRATQLSYLWSLDFVPIFTSPALRGWRRAALLLAIPFLLVLTSLVGPSSAVLMIPRPDTPYIDQKITLYSLNSIQDIYPSFLNQANGLSM